jgi:hypothetical protein
MFSESVLRRVSLSPVRCRIHQTNTRILSLYSAWLGEDHQKLVCLNKGPSNSYIIIAEGIDGATAMGLKNAMSSIHGFDAGSRATASANDFVEHGGFAWPGDC